VTSLDALPPHSPAAVTTLSLGEREAAWLRAIGLFEGATVTLLRRAPLGGPLHVRISGGAELAIDRALARQVVVSSEQAAS
jgi:ferrous iron transport protein A